MASRAAIVHLIHQAYDARDKGKIDGLTAAFHPNAAFELKGDKEVLHLVGAVKGRSSVQTAMEGFVATFEFLHRDIINMVVESDRAAVHSRLKVRYVPKDKVFTTDLLDTFRFEDGKFVELVEFADTALIKGIIGT